MTEQTAADAPLTDAELAVLANDYSSPHQVNIGYGNIEFVENGSADERVLRAVAELRERRAAGDPRKDRIYAAISRERAYQDRKWGDLTTYEHTPAMWLAIMQVELAEAARELHYGGNLADAKREALQVAAVAVAFLEQYGLEERPDAATRAAAEKWLREGGA